MVYFRVDPAPFIPEGLHRIDVQACKPMERVVLMRPRAKHQDLAIISIHPMPEQQVTFQAIQDVVSDFLVSDQHVVFMDMQPTHHGQVYVRFRNAYDRDRFIQHGAYQFVMSQLLLLNIIGGENGVPSTSIVSAGCSCWDIRRIFGRMSM